MSRTARALAFTLGALLAMAATASTGALAQEFHAGETGATLTGEQTVRNTMTFNAGHYHCQTANFESIGIQESTESEITVALDYDECRLTAFGGEDLSANVHENGCHYLLTDSGEVHLQCPGAARIEVTMPLCTVRTPPQTFGTVDYLNAGSGTTRELDLDLTVTGITYTQTAFCPTGGGTFSNGTMNGTIRFTGENAGGEHVALRFE